MLPVEAFWQSQPVFVELLPSIPWKVGVLWLWVSSYGVLLSFARSLSYDTVSEWLRRWTRNPLGFARRGSNPLGVVCFFRGVLDFAAEADGILVAFLQPVLRDNTHLNVISDSLAERSKAPDSSSGGAILVGSNPTAVIFFFF